MLVGSGVTVGSGVEVDVAEGVSVGIKLVAGIVGVRGTSAVGTGTTRPNSNPTMTHTDTVRNTKNAVARSVNGLPRCMNVPL